MASTRLWLPDVSACLDVAHRRDLHHVRCKQELNTTVDGDRLRPERDGRGVEGHDGKPLHLVTIDLELHRDLRTLSGQDPEPLLLERKVRHEAAGLSGGWTVNHRCWVDRLHTAGGRS